MIRKLARILLLLPLLLVLQGQVTQQSKTVSILTFGADPTGVADTYTAFNKAILAGATRIEVPPGKYLLAGAGTVALNNIEIDCHGAPAGLNTATYGSTGATFLLTSTTVQPFTVQNGVRIKGCNFFWPNQTGASPTPTAYPPLFTEPTGQQLNSFVLESDRIINAYDVLDQSALGDFFGDIMLANTQGYAIRYWFRLENVSEWVHATNFHADYGLYQNVANAGPNYYLANWTAANGAVFDVFGNGNCSTVGSTGNVGGIDFTGTVFAYNKFVWVECSGNLSESKFRVMLDAVQHAFEVDAGGCAADVDLHGSYLDYLAVFPLPGGGGQGGSDNAATITIGTSPNSNCATTDVRFTGDLVTAQGDFIDITDTGSKVKGIAVNVSGVGPFGATSAAGTYYFTQVNAPGAIVDFFGNHIETAAGKSGATRQGLNFISCLSCTANGNSFNGIYNEILVGSSSIPVAGCGNVAFGTPAGGRAVIGTGDDVHRLLACNRWDQGSTALPTISACGTSPTQTGNSTDVSGTVGVGTGATTSCTITFANAWLNIPRCYVSGPAASAQPLAVAVTTSVLTVTSNATMGGMTLFYRCDSGW